MNESRIDCYVAGFFAGMLFLCALMAVVPQPLNCQVSVYRHGQNIEVVRYGIVTKD